MGILTGGFLPGGNGRSSEETVRTEHNGRDTDSGCGKLETVGSGNWMDLPAGGGHPERDVYAGSYILLYLSET